MTDTRQSTADQGARYIPTEAEAVAGPPESAEYRPRRELGSLEGIVTTLKSGQQDHFILKERLHGVEVRCQFPATLEQQVRDIWKHRVLVYGVIEYGTDSKPETIEASMVRELAAVESLPQFKDFGIDITGGMESSEYVRGLRDED